MPRGASLELRAPDGGHWPSPIMKVRPAPGRATTFVTGLEHGDLAAGSLTGAVVRGERRGSVLRAGLRSCGSLPSLAHAGPLMVLVHSPFLGPSAWAWVARELEQRDRPVVVPALRLVADEPFRPSRDVWETVDAVSAHAAGSVVLAGSQCCGIDPAGDRSIGPGTTTCRACRCRFATSSCLSPRAGTGDRARPCCSPPSRTPQAPPTRAHGAGRPRKCTAASTSTPSAGQPPLPPRFSTSTRDVGRRLDRAARRTAVAAAKKLSQYRRGEGLAGSAANLVGET